jgi:hypothetical protein
MNERIKQLAEQANLWVMENSPSSHILSGSNQKFLDKFAELIVADCLDVVAMRIYLGPVEMCRQECKALASEIKEHFGVEE